MEEEVCNKFRKMQVLMLLLLLLAAVGAAAGCMFLVACSWLLAVGCWLLLVLPRSIRFLQLQPSQKLHHRPRAHY